MRGINISKYFFLYITPLVYWGFYNYVGFSSTLTKLPCFILTLLLIVLFNKDIFLKKYQKGSYSIYVKFYIILVILSMLMAFLFWGQSLSQSYRATSWNFVFLFYFVLLKYQPSAKEIFIIVMIFSSIYIVLWIISLLNAPIPLFAGDDKELNDSRGVFRIIINSYDIVCLGYFCCLSKIRNGRFNLFWMIVTFFFFVMVVLGLTRLIIAASILITLVYLYIKMTWRGKVLSVLCALLFLLSFSSVFPFVAGKNDSGIASSMIELTDGQLDDISEDNSNWRIIEYKIGFWEYPRNIITYILGSGIPHPESSYGKFEESLKKLKKFNRSDAGYPAILISFGLTGLTLIIAMFIKASRQKTLEEADPYKLFVIFIAIINVMQDAICSFGVAIAISLYILEQDRIYKNNLKRI